MKEQGKIPVGKVSRAARFVKTGAKVGGNYIKHYGRKLKDPKAGRDQLDKENAEDIYDSLSVQRSYVIFPKLFEVDDISIIPTWRNFAFSLGYRHAYYAPLFLGRLLC